MEKLTATDQGHASASRPSAVTDRLSPGSRTTRRIQISDCTVFHRLVTVLSIPIFLLASLAIASGTAVRATGLRRRVFWPPPVAEFGGVRITATPGTKPLSIKFETVNGGRKVATLFEISNPPRRPHGCRLHAFDRFGNSLPDSTAWLKKVGPPHHSRLVHLAPRHSISEIFTLAGRFKLAPPGRFYFYAVRSVITGSYKGGNPAGFAQASLISPILQLTLRKGHAPTWNIVQAVPKPKETPSNAVLATAPRFPEYRIPTTGPIATLAQIAQAAKSHDLAAVRKFCYDGHHAAEPFYVALAEQAIAEGRCVAAAKERFGIDPWPQIEPSPAAFSQLLLRLNPQSLKVHNDLASVGVLWLHAGKLIPFPSFAYHFRKVRGYWLLDSWATQSSIPHSSERSYRLNVDNCLKQARVFDHLKRDLVAGKFADLRTFKVFARRRMGAVSDWFVLQSMKGNKQWMKNNAQWVKRVKGEGKPSATQPSKAPH